MRLRRLLRVSSLVISTVVLLAAAFFVLATRFTVPGGFRAYTVLTGSMSPMVPAGSLIVTSIPDGVASLQAGDIITFAQPGVRDRLITHRVAAIDTSGEHPIFTTKGDANDAADSWKLGYAGIQGKYHWHVPYLGRGLEFVKSPLGVFLLIVLPMLVIMVEEIKNIVGALLDKKLAQLQQLKMQLERLRRQPPGSRRARRASPTLTPVQSTGTIDSAQERPREKQSMQLRQATIKSMALVLFVSATFGVGSSLGLFTSNTVTIGSTTVTTAGEFPTPTPTDGPTPSPSPDVDGVCDTDIEVTGSNTNTGPGSTNTNEAEIDVDCAVTQTNEATIENDITIDANTGGNTVEDNTAGGSVTTGDITFDLSIGNSITPGD